MSERSVVSIPTNTSLFKGDTVKYIYQYLPEEEVTYDRKLGSVFFTLDGVVPGKDVATTYGVVFEFKTTHTLNLMDVDNVKNLKFLYDSADKTIQTILRTNYGYDPMTKTIGKRFSVHSADKTLSEFLCAEGFDGYISSKATTDFSGEFHKEMMLCDVNKIRFSGLVSTPDEIDTVFKKLSEDLLKMTKVTKKRKGSEESEKIRDLISLYNNRNNPNPTNDSYSSPTKKSYGSPTKRTRSNDSYTTPGGGKRSLRKKSTTKKRKYKRNNTKKH
jgi:hypothetical protein